LRGKGKTQRGGTGGGKEVLGQGESLLKHAYYTGGGCFKPGEEILSGKSCGKKKGGGEKFRRGL